MTTDAKSPKVEALGRRIDRLHRRILDPEVLQGALPIRAGTLPYRSATAEARAREARFREVSPTYVTAFADHDAFASQTQVMDLQGLTWWVPILRPDDEADVARYLRHQNFPYRAITQTRELAIGGVMLDIGGNNGRMAIPRVILGDVTSVYCAEPEPLNYTCLVRNVRDNHLAGLVMPDHVAIGAANGTARLERAKTAGGHKVLADGVAPVREMIEVPLFTLDSWIERLGVDPQAVVFVKVDVQGSEMDVLGGGSRLLASRHIAWQMEIDPPLLAKRGYQFSDLQSVLQRHFTHLIDLNRDAGGGRARPLTDFADALAYITGPDGSRTDVVLFSSDRQIDG